MAATIPASHRDLFEKPNFGHLATLMPDGSPQVTPVWVDLDGDIVVVNSAEGRVKTRNLDRDGRAAISVADQQNPYRYIQVRGRVISRTREGADAHIDRLAKKYLGQDTYPFRQPGEQRVVYRIQPEYVQFYG
jgi:PPOX class probable F420-dependent enzyme